MDHSTLRCYISYTITHLAVTAVRLWQRYREDQEPLQCVRVLLFGSDYSNVLRSCHRLNVWSNGGIHLTKCACLHWSWSSLAPFMVNEKKQAHQSTVLLVLLGTSNVQQMNYGKTVLIFHCW